MTQCPRIEARLGYILRAERGMTGHLLALVVLVVFACASAGLAREVGGEAQMAEGDRRFERGDYEAAMESWKMAAKAYEKAADRDSHRTAILRQVAACRALGQSKLALSLLAAAEELVKPGEPGLAEIKAVRGAMAIFSKDAADAEALLRESLKLARVQKDGALAASVLNDLGVLLSSRGEGAEAVVAFEQAASMAEGMPGLRAKIRKNMADAALRSGDFANARKWAAQTVKYAATIADGHDKAFLLMGAGQIYSRLFVEAEEHDNGLRAQAFKWDQEAEAIARRIGDDRALSYALGYQGALYEFEKRFAEALALTRHALASAQRAQSPDALYRWQWQSARILASQGERQAAIEAYRRAVATLQTIRNDVSIRYGNQSAGSSFREVAGGVYYELADLLLQSADAKKGDNQALLREARDATELLKSAELEDYFQDDCVNLRKGKTKKVESVSSSAAIIYIIPLRDRTEILVSLPAGELVRFRIDTNAEALTAIVRRFRLNLEDVGTDAYLDQAGELYATLIKPLEGLMAQHHLDTMVFVPDGALRTIPMAALHDGKQFLVEKYAVAVSPGLELMESKPIRHGESRVLINGLSQGVQGFAPLGHVPQEIASLEKLYSQKDTMMNERFLHSSVAKKLTEEEFMIVHIASHGHFDSDVRKSFVLTFDKQLTLDELERCIRPAQLRDRPLEMLTLSACQTAAGDDRAALGLAGVAVKAGARSAFATLWFVNDEASTEVIKGFYGHLVANPTQSKARALQVAQKSLLTHSRFHHPCYWAPYLIIGNWM